VGYPSIAFGVEDFEEAFKSMEAPLSVSFCPFAHPLSNTSEVLSRACVVAATCQSHAGSALHSVQVQPSAEEQCIAPAEVTI
jgi:hypothetical protein